MGLPGALVWWKTPTSPTWSTALPPAWKGWLSVGAQGRDKWVTHVNADIASEGFLPSDHSLRVSQDGSFEETYQIAWTLVIKSQLLAKLWLLHYFEGPEVRVIENSKAGWGLWIICGCNPRTGRAWSWELSWRDSTSAITAVLMRLIRPSIWEHILWHWFVPNIGVGVIWTAGVLGIGMQSAICFRVGMIVFLRNSSELTAINPRACSAQYSQRMTST